MTTTTAHRPVLGLLGETAAGTATAAAGHLHRHAAPLALLALAVSAVHAGAYRPSRPHR